MTKITDSQPEVVEIDARIAQTREQERKVAEKSAGAAAKHQAALAKWRATAEQDVRAGRDPKPAPPVPDESARNMVLAEFRAEIERDVKERRRATVRAEAAIRAEVEQEVARLLGEARGPVDDLDAAVAAVRAALAALDEVADAKHALDPTQTTRHRRPPVVDIAALVSAVKHGPEGLIGGRDNPKPRTLGVQPGSTLGLPATKPPEAIADEVEPEIEVRIVKTSEGAEL